MKGIYLLLGSNLGERELTIHEAINRIGENHGKLIKQSSLYESAAWGLEDQPTFLNQVIQIESSESPHELLQNLQTIEKALGRKKIIKWGERVIDIDILYYGSEILNSENLSIPHPEIQNRRFTLLPMTELAPEFIHPTLKKNQQILLEECEDKLWVTPVNS